MCPCVCSPPLPSQAGHAMPPCIAFIFFQQQPQNFVLKANKTKTTMCANHSDESRFQANPFHDAHQKPMAESHAKTTKILAQIW